MRTPGEVAAMLELKRRGWGCERIAREFGSCPKTVRRYVREGGWTGYARVRRAPVLAGLEAWLAERLARHGGNADVVRQELAFRTRPGGEPAHGRAGLRAVSATTPGIGAGDGALRDAARRADADRLRRAPGVDREGAGAGASVRGDLGVSRSEIAWATRAGCTCAPFAVRLRSAGLRAWRARSAPSGACRRRCCSTTPAPSSSTTTRARARWCSTRACTRLRLKSDRAATIHAVLGLNRVYGLR